MLKLQLPRAFAWSQRGEKSARPPDTPSEPISLVAAEIHRGFWPAVITDSWLEISYSNYVPMQQFL
jgi:hypothetical protein